MGVEVVIGALIAWAVAKARRTGRQADEIVNEALDTAMGRVHDVVLAKVGGDPAVAKLEIEAATAEGVSDRTRQRVQLAIQDAIEEDPDFAAELVAAAEQLEPPPARPQVIRQSVSGKVAGPNVMIGGSIGGSVHVETAGKDA